MVGVIFSVPPAFYPSEAEDRGVSPSQVRLNYIFLIIIVLYSKYLQYGFVFGISNLSAAIFALVFAVYGSRYVVAWKQH